MSLINALGSQVRRTAQELPLAEVTAALHRLRAVSALLRGVRGASPRPVGLARLAHAIEHAEHAGHALRVAQDAMDEYLAAIGLTTTETAVPAPGPARVADRPTARVAPPPVTPATRTTHSWWTRRVDRLTADTDDGPAGSAPGATSSADLLDAVVRRVRARDRAGLRRDLRAAPVPVALGLSGVAADALRRAAGDALGHPPLAGDLADLRRRAAGTVRAMLPGADPRVADLLLARACRMAPSSVDFPAPHPADTAVTGAVLVGAVSARAPRRPDAPAEGRSPHA